MEKALREAKRNTQLDRAQPRLGGRRCWPSARALYAHAPVPGRLRALRRAGSRRWETGSRSGMLALKLTAPGVPDIYQGDELPLRALVDPDNRRPVDWEWRQAMLAPAAGRLPARPPTRKLWLTPRLLQLRIRRPEAFAGGYEPLDAGEHCVAFLRGGEVLVVVATRAGVPDGDCVPRRGAGAGGTCSGRGTRTLSAEEPTSNDDCSAVLGVAVASSGRVCKRYMRVLLISWEYPPIIEGGLARHVRKLSEHLVAEGVEVHVLTRGGGRLPATGGRHGVVVHRRAEPPFPKDVGAFVRWVDAMNADMRELGEELSNGCDSTWFTPMIGSSPVPPTIARRIGLPWLDGPRDRVRPPSGLGPEVPAVPHSRRRARDGPARRPRDHLLALHA